MVLLAIQSSAGCQLLDQYGQPIGVVHQSASDQIVGKGAGTVLLSRPIFRSAPDRPSAATHLAGRRGMNWN